jgi:hypothetical protein
MRTGIKLSCRLFVQSPPIPNFLEIHSVVSQMKQSDRHMGLLHCSLCKERINVWKLQAVKYVPLIILKNELIPKNSAF